MTKPLLSDRAIAKARYVIERAMTYTCDVERPTSAGVDGYGHPLPPTWVTHLTNQKCLLIPFVVGSTRTGEQQNVNTAYDVGAFKQIFPYATDITVLDRVLNLRDRTGALVDGTVQHYEIKDRLPSETDVTLVIQAIR